LGGCAGAAAQGASCAAGAAGASAGVLVNILLGDTDGLSAAQKEARKNLVTTLVAGLASSANPANEATAVTAAAIETENNALSLRGSARLMNTLRRCEGSNAACNIEDLKQEMKRDTDKQSERIAAACTGATADLANCMQLSNNANTVAMNLLNSTNYSDSPEKKAMLMELINQQLADIDALNKLVESNVTNASFKEAVYAGIVGSLQMLTMAGVRVKGGNGKPIANVVEADNRLPIPSPTKANNGFMVESNKKHTPGASTGRNNDAGQEPRNSINIFEVSIATKDPNVRLARDGDGNIHRFFSDGNGTFHWTSSTGDLRAPITIDQLRQAGFATEIRQLGARK
jgi:filamentous hemagglutinin